MNFRKLKTIFLGKALESSDIEGEKLGCLWGLPIMASDAVSSVAYAIEEMLYVLLPVAGLAAVRYIGIVSAPIILLFFVLAFSYSQIIDSYPNGGGAYIVSAENIGRGAAMVAASSLIIAYVMTVAVSLSAATAALISALPGLEPYKLPVSLIFLCVITLLNLRGLRESSKIFGIPTYAFIVMMVLLIITGFVKLAAGTLEPVTYTGGDLDALQGTGVVTGFLLLRAFSSGCSALTGVEAVSNAVPSFREPAQRNAKTVLFLLVGIIVFVFGGSVLLDMRLGVLPLENQTVISQMGRAVFGMGPLYYILQFVTSLILLLAANTAYTGLPTLLAILAEDGYMPRQFMHRGTRLSFSNGILFIFFTAALLLVIFKAETHYLIPLYSIGVFISFTLSQSGMVIRWHRLKSRGYRHKLAINALGAVMTATGTIIVFATKFADGSWALAFVIPLVSLLMLRIHSHYQLAARQLRIDDFMAHYHKSISQDKNLCIVLVGSMNRSVLKALNYANLISSNVVALHVSTDTQYSQGLKKRWEESGIDIPLDIVYSPYRELVEPVEAYIGRREAELHSGDTITVVMARFAVAHWTANFLHNQSAYFVMKHLRSHRNVATVLVPYLYTGKQTPHHTEENRTNAGPSAP